MTKVVIVLAVLLIGVGFAWKEEAYKGGIKDATLMHVAEASDRSVETARLRGKSLAASERAMAEGEADVAAQRRRSEAAEVRAREARAEASAARAELTAALADRPECPQLPPEPTTCPADLKLVQP